AVSLGQVANMHQPEESPDQNLAVPKPSGGHVANVPKLEASLDLAAQILAEFKGLTRRPSIEVSPNGERMGRSVGHYVVKPLLEGFLRNLDALDFEAQEQILYQAAQACRQHGSAEFGVRSAELRETSAEFGRTAELGENSTDGRVRNAEALGSADGGV